MPEANEPTVPVKYIGRHEHTKDSIYNTGEWDNGQIKLVPATTAERMFAHIDAYVPASVKEAKGALAAEVKATVDEDARKIDEAAMEEAREAIRTMPKDKLIEYGAVHYGLKLDARKSEENLRAEINQSIDRFGAQ